MPNRLGLQVEPFNLEEHFKNKLRLKSMLWKILVSKAKCTVCIKQVSKVLFLRQPQLVCVCICLFVFVSVGTAHSTHSLGLHGPPPASKPNFTVLQRKNWHRSLHSITWSHNSQSRTRKAPALLHTGKRARE